MFQNTPLKSDFYSANGTVEITFKYEPGAWPLGTQDLDVMPMFHLITCAEPDLTQGVPLPEFIKGSLPNTLVGRVGSDMMYRKCRFVYYAQSISSRKCATETEIRTPPSPDLQTLTINCDTVEGNPCVRVDIFPAPVCGQINDIDYKISKKYIAPGDKDYSLTLNVTFEPIRRENEPPTIYYKAFYGDALPYAHKEEEALAGVNMTKVIGSTTNCLQFDQNGFCLENTGNNVNVSGLSFDKLYGITFCAVKDPRNLTIPDLTDSSRAVRPRTNKIYVDSKDQAGSKAGMIIGIVFGAIVLLIAGIIGICCYINRKQKQENKLYQLKLAQLEREKECRYTDFPKNSNKIENWNPYLSKRVPGKLLGKSLGHKDSTSPLGVNLMRAENCQVAVKMLPEYADEMSRSDFLREIGLMKTLGYHERLVNMLACITESEPLCLIVEYCSDGDLLRFLRERCKYMMKLDAAGVNYHEPPVDNSYDIEMVITLKQLLMFAVQVSYGLEYLSSKGFVHRDVAARNVLVHGKNACKIGDFGLCRNLYADNSLYKSKGGRLPLKWMSPEAIRHYEFSAQSDVWAFGVLLFEIITLGGSPYPSVSPEEMLPFLENGGRMERPDNCPENFYEVMCECWTVNPRLRPDFSVIRQKLASLLEEITEEYSYLTLDAQKDYYNVQYGDQKPDVIVIPESETISIEPMKKTLDTSMLSIDSLPIDDVTTWSDGNSTKDFQAGDVARRKTASDGTDDSMLGVDNSAFKGDSL
ncbi:protein tyrosine kinase [Ostertagia ostertagi]